MYGSERGACWQQQVPTRQRIIGILAGLLCLAIYVQAANAQTVYLRPHDLFVQALKNGSAAGELQGAVAERFARQFQCAGPLLARVKVVKRYEQEGCGRLNLVLTQKDVDTPKGRTDAILRMQLNYCKDGSPPVSRDAFP